MSDCGSAVSSGTGECRSAVEELARTTSSLTVPHCLTASLPHCLTTIASLSHFLIEIASLPHFQCQCRKTSSLSGKAALSWTFIFNFLSLAPASTWNKYEPCFGFNFAQINWIKPQIKLRFVTLYSLFISSFSFSLAYIKWLFGSKEDGS